MNVPSRRSWPLPPRPFTMYMDWHDLLFAHWPVSPAALRSLIPDALEIDTFEGQAWIGVVPFRMSNIRHRLLPGIPGLSAFPELNVRTYVSIDNKPGVWFFSLDATSKIAVRVARRWFSLPYMDADIELTREPGGSIEYRSTRTHRDERPAELDVRYRPVGDPFVADPGTLEFWLTARYCLYSANRKGVVFRGDIDHDAWQLHHAEAEFRSNTMVSACGIEAPTGEPLLHFVKDIETRAWSPTALSSPVD